MGGVGRVFIVLAAIAVVAGAAYSAFVLMQSLQRRTQDQSRHRAKPNTVTA